jgi:hypothetical protein
LDIRAVPVLSATPFFDEISPDLHHVHDLQEPRLVSIQSFRLQSRGGWTSAPIGPDGGEADSANREFKVSVPAGVFPADYRVVVTKVPITDHTSFRSTDDIGIDDVNALEFEAILVDENNQVVPSFPSSRAVTLEFNLPEYAGMYYSLGKAASLDLVGLRNNPEPDVINGWNADSARYGFSLPHFSQWKIFHSGDDPTLWRDARVERRTATPKKVSRPIY